MSEELKIAYDDLYKKANCVCRCWEENQPIGIKMTDLADAVDNVEKIKRERR